MASPALRMPSSGSRRLKNITSCFSAKPEVSFKCPYKAFQSPGNPFLSLLINFSFLGLTKDTVLALLTPQSSYIPDYSLVGTETSAG